MFFYLLILFLVLPFVDLYLLLRLSSMIGFLPTLGLVIATGVAGAWLVKREGRFVFRKLSTSVTAGEMSRNFLEAALLVVAGLLLISPGLITDLIGFLLALRPLRERIVVRLTERFKRSSDFEAKVIRL